MQTLNSAAWRSVEQVSVLAPLGIRFWDPAFDVQISDSLAVTAWPADPNGDLAPRQSPAVCAHRLRQDPHGLTGCQVLFNASA